MRRSLFIVGVLFAAASCSRVLPHMREAEGLHILAIEKRDVACRKAAFTEIEAGHQAVHLRTPQARQAEAGAWLSLQSGCASMLRSK